MSLNTKAALITAAVVVAVIATIVLSIWTDGAFALWLIVLICVNALYWLVRGILEDEYNERSVEHLRRESSRLKKQIANLEVEQAELERGLTS